MNRTSLLPEELARLVDRLRDAYEAASEVEGVAGERPRIEDVANEAPEEVRGAVIRKLIELDKKNAAAHHNLGVAQGMKCFSLLSPDPKRRAVEAVNEMVKLAPESAAAWQFRGWVEYRVGNYRAGIEALEKSCKLENGGDSTQWIVLALAHAGLDAQDGLSEKERDHHNAEARRRYEQADKHIDSKRHVGRPRGGTYQAVWDFRAEARELLKIEKKKD